MKGHNKLIDNTELKRVSAQNITLFNSLLCSYTFIVGFYLIR